MTPIGQITDLAAWLGVVERLGSAGLFAWVLWKLLDKWGGKLVDAQEKQATALTGLAEAVKTSQTDQRDVLLAVRVLAVRMEELSRFVVQVDEHVQQAGRMAGQRELKA
jgi:hypothetical protein